MSVSNIKGTSNYYLPSHVVIELTDACNLKCVHCYRVYSRDEYKYIDYDGVKDLLHAFSNETVCSVEFTDGEPTLHPNFLEIIKFAAQHFWLVGVLTNGTELSDEILKELSLYKDRIFWSISLDSHDKNYHDKFRGKRGAWEETISNIKKLVSMGYYVRIAMCVTHENIYHIENVAKLCTEIGIKAFSYSPVLPFGKACNYIWQYDDIVKLSEIDKYVCQKYKNIIPSIQLKEFNQEHINENCGAGWKSIVVDPQFNVRPCVMADSSKDIIGSIKLSDTISFFEKQKEIINWWANLKSPRKEICGECRFLNFCIPCPFRVRRLLESGFISREKCVWNNKYKIMMDFDYK
uniref:Radical SAM protein n=1 Tax=Caldicellulosiruptor owensensis TaxID=55205 RepID=A0A7C5V153_9FIRM